MSTPERYLIWSFEHRAWWGPGRVGCTTATHRAGIYTAEEANEICDEANRTAVEDFMVPAPSRSQIEPIWAQTGQTALPQPSSTRTNSQRQALACHEPCPLTSLSSNFSASSSRNSFSSSRIMVIRT